MQQVLNSVLGPLGRRWTVSSRLPSARYVARRGQSMASGTIQHFPSEDQQCFDLWDSSLSAVCEVMFSRPSVWSCVFLGWGVFRSRLYQQNCRVMKIWQHTAACPEPSSKHGWKKALRCHCAGRLGMRQSAMCGLCLLLIKSQ